MFVVEVAPYGHFEVEALAGSCSGPNRAGRVGEIADQIIDVAYCGCGRGCTGGWDELELSVSVAGDGPSAVVNGPVMSVAQINEVDQIGAAIS